MQNNSSSKYYNWLSILFGGVFIGFISTFWAISVAALLFSGKLTAFLGTGISMMLMGHAVMCALIAIYSPLVGDICIIQEPPAIILVTIINSIILANADIDNQTLFVSITIIITITTLITGLFFFILGKFKLGDLVKYIPYPVISGFLAGTGWVMFQSGIEFLLRGQETIFFASIFEMTYLVKCSVGLIFGIALFFILNRYSSIFILPVILIVTIGSFYLILLVFDISVAEISGQGWLLGPIPEITDKSLIFFSLNKNTIDWIFVLKQVNTNIYALLLVSTVCLLLNINSIELVIKQDIDLNKSLKATGFANICAAFFGSSVGFSSVSMSPFGYKMNIASRSLGIITAIVTITMLYFFLPVLNLLPKFVVGGFLIYIGIDFLYNWTYSVWFKLSKAEYAIVLLVMLIIVANGFIQGIIIGIVAAIFLFIVDFSKVSIIKNTLTGKELSTNNQRTKYEQQILFEHGEQIKIFVLQSFLFFGTSNKLFVSIKEHIDELSNLKYLIFDWQYVTGMDSSTVYSLQKIQQLAETYYIQLIFTNIPDDIKAILDKSLTNSTSLQYFSDLSHGLEWCENQVLQQSQQRVNNH